ncbi:MAG: PKD domain-containing protein [Vicinamibacterales bacterium]
MKLREIIPVVAVLSSVGFGGGVPPDAAADDFKLSMRASPSSAFAPATITFIAQLRGGGDEERCYCPTVEWDWGDGTTSQRTGDCEPYEPGKSKLERFFTGAHKYKQGGRYQVRLRLKRGGQLVVSGGTVVIIRPRVDEGEAQQD